MVCEMFIFIPRHRNRYLAEIYYKTTILEDIITMKTKKPLFIIMLSLLLSGCTCSQDQEKMENYADSIQITYFGNIHEDISICTEDSPITLQISIGNKILENFDSEIHWYTEDDSVIEIVPSGTSCKIVPLSEGNTVLSCNALNQTARCIIRVYEPGPLLTDPETYLIESSPRPLVENGENTLHIETPAGIEESFTMNVGDFDTISVADEAGIIEGNNGTISWFTSNHNIVKITFWGSRCEVHAMGQGTAKITCKAYGYEASCIIQVENPNNTKD